jgi:hypothetical protein
VSGERLRHGQARAVARAVVGGLVQGRLAGERRTSTDTPAPPSVSPTVRRDHQAWPPAAIGGDDFSVEIADRFRP